jgi:tetratricopeptide (TPR) repeat protein
MALAWAPLRLAHAEPTKADARAEAQAHSEAGQKYFRLGDFARAAKEFKAAYESVPSPTLLYNLGQTYRQLQDFKQALFFYRQFIATGPDDEDRRAAQERVEQLEKLVQEQEKAEKAPPTGTSTPSSTAPETKQAEGSSQTITAVAPPRTERPVYKRPWFWGVVAGGAIVVAGAVTLGVVFGSSTKNPAATMGVAGAMGF